MSKVTNEVSYELSLKDLFSAKIKSADEGAEHFEGTMQTIMDKANQVGVTLGVAFSVEKLIEFGRTSNEVFEGLEKANAQLQAGLESTHNKAGLTMQSLQQDQEDFRQKVDYSKAAISGMQGILLTFPEISKDVFGAAEGAVFDMATRMQQDVKSTAIEIGKALADPSTGVTALRRMGVEFSKQQEASLSNMVHNGNLAQAQMTVLTELNREFGGSAEAAARANPFFEYQKALEDLQTDIGSTVNQLNKEMAPSLTELVHNFKDAFDWAIRNRDTLEALGKVVVEVGIGYAAWNAIESVRAKITAVGNTLRIAQAASFRGITIAEMETAVATGEVTASELAYEAAASELTIAQIALNAAMDAFPAIALVAGVAALIGLLWNAADASNAAKNSYEGLHVQANEILQVQKKAADVTAEKTAQMKTELDLTSQYKNIADDISLSEATRNDALKEAKEHWATLRDLGGEFTSNLDAAKINIQLATDDMNDFGTAVYAAAIKMAAMETITQNSKDFIKSTFELSQNENAAKQLFHVKGFMGLDKFSDAITKLGISGNEEMAIARKDLFYSNGNMKTGDVADIGMEMLVHDIKSFRSKKNMTDNAAILQTATDAAQGINLTKGQQGTIAATVNAPGGGTGGTGSSGAITSGTETKGATGNKSTTFNIKIDKLGEIHIQTNNIHDSYDQIQKHVLGALQGAINEGQRLAHD